jgi:hypothetical protein
VCVCAKFGFLLGKTAVETVTVLKEAVKHKSMSNTSLYPWMKQVLKWRCFANIAAIQQESLAALDGISVVNFR